MSSASSKRRQADKVARHRGREKSSVKKAALWAGGALLLVILVPSAIAAWFVWNVSSTFNDTKETIPEAFPEEQSRPVERVDDAQTILLLGSDKRGEVDPDSINNSQDSRSDSIMVVRIPSSRDGVYITSIMRDSWVDVPGYGDNKINAAFAYGGVPLTVQTVENLLETRIDHVAIIDFDGFKGLTNALGGITVNNQNTFDAGRYHFEQGEITLDGDQALTFVRERKSFADGDYQRVRNQQAYMKGLISKLLSRDTLTNPGKISEAVAEISPFIATDADLTAGYIIGLAPSLRSIRSEDIHFLALPTSGVGTSADGQSIINLDYEKLEQYRQAFRDDNLSSLLSTV